MFTASPTTPSCKNPYTNVQVDCCHLCQAAFIQDLWICGAQYPVKKSGKAVGNCWNLWSTTKSYRASRGLITPDCICKRKFFQHKLSLNKATFWRLLRMTSLARIAGIHFFSTIVALLCLHKIVGLWKGSPASLQQSGKCPEWGWFRKQVSWKQFAI